ncbi:hypothetical protein PN836_007705 [Ningiella sp. W23]|uniref:hypothetical protein n=1 Tax=Ningiella sp. W23 TaxID=3023715 RepID=UPI003756A3A6
MHKERMGTKGYASAHKAEFIVAALWIHDTPANAPVYEMNSMNTKAKLDSAITSESLRALLASYN